MSRVREQFRSVLARPTCTLAANIFDPLSASIAHMLEYEVCVLSGSVGKVANLGVPDGVLSNMSDVVDHCRRITRIADVSLMVDAEDGFGNAVNVARTVREMEAAGVSAIEIEDNFVPKEFNVQNPGLISKEEQVGKLQAAVAARTDLTTVIVARSAALGLTPLDEALDRIQAYSQTGAEALMLTGSRSRDQLEAVHRVTTLPICVLSPPADIRNDTAFLAATGVKILMLGNPTFSVTVKAIFDSLEHLKEGGSLEELGDRQATPELLRSVNRTDEFLQWQEQYLRS
ncbi:MAG TPA: isocitrate lyase/PEP mutase family protein [Dehalococcoidia bacterium]|nr:isocitrate lyase/PEP mutase family protein [Dehalococcoidia bacterium]MEE2927794.1 isocitrate lyase/PEP mutase family protein [Chloroflexota bacterium]HIB12903.1 isocitrate lyase/PEP mutase family protein [Dehalococcoidia bacterium]HIM48973.1 isocitrate lyase/PEP mutase family protein [Dehalococcoidia bacterium]